MNFKLLIFTLTLFIVLVAFKQQTEKNTILWDEKTPLTWNDFKGKPQKRFAAASTSYNILKKINKENSQSVSVKIEAVFFCESSWKKKEWINNSVLLHEQKHFDIVELFARKLRQLISQNNFVSYSDVIIKSDSLYTIIDKEMDKYQDLYDEETDGSMNGDKQREWMAKIMKEIKDLDSYKIPSITITFSTK